MIGPAGLNQSQLTLGVLPANLASRMNKGGVITPLGPDIKITITRAEHSSELVWKNATTGKDETHVGGKPVGFIIEFENGFKVYHMGDTGLFGDMRWIGEYYKPDLLRDESAGCGRGHARDAQAQARHPDPLRHVPGAARDPGGVVKALGQTTTKVHPLDPGDKLTF
jgi:L-ascorbate metabolism protein UlaG (beta-lactamase superfamily)